MAIAQPLLEDIYTIEDPETVRVFLDQHPFLVPVLFEARPKIEQHFPGSPVYLEVWAEPANLSDVELFVSIAPTTSPEDAIARFDSFNDDWWAARVQSAGNKLAIIIEYR